MGPQLGSHGVRRTPGDCRASNDTRTQLQRWLAGRSVEEGLFGFLLNLCIRFSENPLGACKWPGNRLTGLMQTILPAGYFFVERNDEPVLRNPLVSSCSIPHEAQLLAVYTGHKTTPQGTQINLVPFSPHPFASSHRSHRAAGPAFGGALPGHDLLLGAVALCAAGCGV